MHETGIVTTAIVLPAPLNRVCITLSAVTRDSGVRFVGEGQSVMGCYDRIIALVDTRTDWFQCCMLPRLTPDGVLEAHNPPESLESQVERLGAFISDQVPGEPSMSQGAVDTAIRLLRGVYEAKAAEVPRG